MSEPKKFSEIVGFEVLALNLLLEIYKELTFANYIKTMGCDETAAEQLVNDRQVIEFDKSVEAFSKRQFGGK